jgi:hypothetical protein
LRLKDAVDETLVGELLEHLYVGEASDVGCISTTSEGGLRVQS